jgi:prepilin-type N-terminal cleavage/methylation domain-containing protein/prepilin-type processing-associated H-X9-DG protein
MSMRRPPERRAPRGFTLVELLVVIGIIALLISILLPALNNARRQARTVQCASAMRQFGQANGIYVSEQKGWCVPVKTAAGSNPDTAFWGTLSYHAWYHNEVMRKILGMPFPPIAKTGNGGTTYSTSDWVENWTDGLLCPESAVSRELKKGTITHSYGWNRTTLGHIGDPQWTKKLSPAFNAGLVVKISQVKRSAEKIQMLDGNWFYLEGPWMDRGDVASSNSGPAEVADSPADWRKKWDVYGDREPGGGNPNTVSYRHKQGANVLFYDGHVSWMPKQDIHRDDPIQNAKIWNIIEAN